MIEDILLSESLNIKITDLITKKKDLDSLIKREEKLLEDEIYEMAKYIKTKLSLGLDIFRIRLPDTSFETKKIISYILNKFQRKYTDNIVLRQYLISYPEFIDTLKLKELIADPKELLFKISQHLKIEEVFKDKVIFYNGQLGKTFYLILEGEVSVLLPYEYRVNITVTQLFEYMKFLLKHKEYELIRLILESNSMILNDNDYGDNQLYKKFKSVIDKPLPVYIDTEKISSKDYIKRYNFFPDLDKKPFLNNLKINKEKNEEKKESKEESKEIDKSKSSKSDKKVFKIKNYKKYSNININKIKFKDKKIKFNIIEDKKNKNEDKKNKNEDKNNKNEDKNSKNEDKRDNDKNNYKEDKIEKKEDKIKDKEEKKENDEEETDINKAVCYNFTVWKYFEVIKLSKGKCFGELALKKEGKKRNATIITTQNSVFGILQKDVYQMFVKETMDKARKINVELLLKTKLFNGYNAEKFESHYFNCFKYMKKNKGEVLFKQGEKRSFIYFIKKGEVQIELYSNCFNIGNIIQNLGFIDEKINLKEMIKTEPELEQFCKINRKFNVLIFSSDIIGLNDHIISDTNEELVFSGVCVTHCELFALDNKFLSTILDDKIIRNNYNKTINERKERLAERLSQLKTNIIIQQYNYIKENDLINHTTKKKINDNDGNIIIKKKEFKLNMNNCIKSDLCVNNNNIINNNNNEIINKTIILKKKSLLNHSRTIGSLLGSNINKTESNTNYKHTPNNEKYNKTNYNLFNKTKKRININNKKNKSISIKMGDNQESISRNDKKQIKEDHYIINYNTIKNTTPNDNNIIKGFPKNVNSLTNNYIQESLLLKAQKTENNSKYTKKDIIKILKNEYDKEKKQKSNSFINYEETKNFVNFGKTKLQKLLLKQPIVVYNAEIDKIDKIIINNYDTVSPLSCKIFSNKEKAKKKLQSIINNEHYEKLKKIQRKNRKYSYLKREKDKEVSNVDETENTINSKNLFSLPALNNNFNRNFLNRLSNKELINIYGNIRNNIE